MLHTVLIGLSSSSSSNLNFFFISSDLCWSSPPPFFPFSHTLAYFWALPSFPSCFSLLAHLLPLNWLLMCEVFETKSKSVERKRKEETAVLLWTILAPAEARILTTFYVRATTAKERKKKKILSTFWVLTDTGNDDVRWWWPPLKLLKGTNTARKWSPVAIILSVINLFPFWASNSSHLSTFSSFCRSLYFWKAKVKLQSFN